MNSFESLASAIVGHLVGDYLLQNDWMALNKKRDIGPCLVHCILWTLSVCLFAGWPVQGTIPAILIATHIVQDHTDVITRWMKLIGQTKFATGPCAPWSVIVVDNVWHILTIWIVWRFVA